MVRPRVEAGMTKFIALTGHSDLTKIACDTGIPTLTKPAPELIPMIMKPELYKAFYEKIRKG